MRAFCSMASGVWFLGSLSVAQQRTASLTGQVEDRTGASIGGTAADLHSEKGPYERYRAVANDLGIFRFPTLLGGDYSLELQQAGFKRLTIKGISVSDGEQKVLPTLRMDVGY